MSKGPILVCFASVPPVPGLHGMLKAGLEEIHRIGDEMSKRTAAEGAETAREAVSTLKR